MINKIIDKLRYLIFKLRYLKTVKCLGKNNIGRRISIRKFNFNEGSLSIVLRENSSLRRDIIIQGSGYFELGEKSFVGSFSVIGCNEYISIGKNCMIADAVSIRDTDHNFDVLDLPMINQGIKTGKVIIEDNVWIGYGAVITKGVKIGEGSIIGANAVVTKDVPKNAIVGGVPAKVIKMRT